MRPPATSSLQAPYNNHGTFQTYTTQPSCSHTYGANQSSRNNRTAASFGAQSPNIPHAGDGAFCGRADVVATAAIAPAIGSNPANTQTPETPHEMHLYETERAPHRR